MKNIFIILLFFLSISSFSQTGELVFKINDKNQVPKMEKELTNNKLKIISIDTKLTETLGKYNFYKFKQLYPSSKRPELLKYYILEAEGHRELMKELKEKHSDKFSQISEYQDPKPLYVPNDYNFTLQIGNDGVRNVGLSYLELINAPKAWDITKGDPNVIIGIIDTHLYNTHEDFVGKLFKVYDANIRSSFYPLSSRDHGTMVAGIVTANNNNNTGFSSIGFNCKIAKTSTNKNDLLLMAIEGVKVINISQDWGPYRESDAILMKELTEDYNVTVVAAAGNENSTRYFYPASYENVISVTSVGHEFDRGTTFSGKQFNWKDCHRKYIDSSLYPDNTHTHNDKVDICAPGYYILTTCHPESYMNGFGVPTGQIYSVSEGTSFAAPMVSGVCALMYSIHPDLTPLEVKSIIQSTAVDIYSIPENADYLGLLGAGRIDAYEAVKKAGTTYLSGQQNSKTISAGYGFVLNNVIVNNNSTISLQARKSLEINGTFEIPIGSTFEFKIDTIAVTMGE